MFDVNVSEVRPVTPRDESAVAVAENVYCDKGVADQRCDTLNNSPATPWGRTFRVVRVDMESNGSVFAWWAVIARN